MAAYSITAGTRRVQYSGSAGTGPYAFTFPIVTSSDIAVYKDATKLVEGSGSSQYQVTISTSDGTGSVTLGTAASSSNTITITGARPVQRTSDFVTAGDLLASTLNSELDSQTIFTQQVSESTDRALQAPVTDPTTIDMTLPAKADRLGKLLGFHSSTGNPEATTGKVASVSISTSTLSAGASATGSATYTESTGALALALGLPIGASGVDGGGLPFTFNSTTTDGNPGSGVFRLNHSSLGSASQIYISDSSAATSNPDVSGYVLTWDDSTTTGDRGTILIMRKDAPQNFAIYKVDDASVDASSYIKLNVAHVASNGTLSGECTFSFFRTGNIGATGASGSGSGDLVGPSGATDNAIARYDGGTGKLVQNSTASLSDAGLLTAKNITVGTAAEADALVLFDGHAVDMYIALDDSADQLVIGTGSTAGTNSILTLTDDSLTIGDGAAADTKLVYDGNSKDFYVGLDDSADKLVIGVGAAVGTNSILTLDDDSVTIGDGAAADTKLVFNGNAQDYYVGLDDSADDLVIGLGSTVGTTPAISIDENQVVSFGKSVTSSTQTATVTGNVTPDFSQFSNFVLTMSGNVTLKDPSTEAVGNSGVFVFIQPSSSAGKTLAVEAQYKTAGDAAYTLSSGVNDVDIIPYFVSASGSIIMGKITKDMAGSA